MVWAVELSPPACSLHSCSLSRADFFAAHFLLQQLQPAGSGWESKPSCGFVLKCCGHSPGPSCRAQSCPSTPAEFTPWSLFFKVFAL